MRRDRVDHEHFAAPTAIPVIGAVVCLYLVTPLSGRPGDQYEIAGALLVIGVVLWAITWAVNRGIYARRTFMRDPGDLSG